MTDKPVYLERWVSWSYEGPHNDPRWVRKDKHGASVCIGELGCGDLDVPEPHECLATLCADSEELAERRARLAAAAPALLRALLAVEWQALGRDTHYTMCPECAWDKSRWHARQCPLDAAISAAGLTTQQERDEARKRIAEERP